MLVLAVALALGLEVVSCLPQPTPHPEMRSTWPDNIFPGEECLPYDGSKVPDCSKFVDPVLKQPYYHEHSSSKTKLCLFSTHSIPTRLQPLLGVRARVGDLSLRVCSLLSLC